MLVSQIMSKKPITLSPDMKIFEAIALFGKKKLKGAPVIEDHKVIGIITEYDILEFIEIHKLGDLWLPAPFDFIEQVIRMKDKTAEIQKSLEKLKNGTVSEIMSKDAEVCGPDDHISKIAAIMTDKNYTMMPVIHEEKLVGVVSRSDLVKGMV